jgi:uncharacterized repeat protein (TIGR03803 family)
MRHYEHLKTTRAQQSVYAPAGTCDGGRPHTVRDDERWRIGISVPRAMRDGLCVNTLRAPYVHDIPYHLNERSGWFPQTSVNIHNGSLYGTTYYEGRRIKHGGGTVFKLTP